MLKGNIMIFIELFIFIRFALNLNKEHTFPWNTLIEPKLAFHLASSTLKKLSKLKSLE